MDSKQDKNQQVIESLLKDKNLNAIYTHWEDNPETIEQYLRDSKSLNNQERELLCEKFRQQQFLFDLLIQSEEFSIDNFEQGLASCLDINAMDSLGNTLLIEAIHMEKLEIVVYLLKQGANPNLSGPNAHPPLVCAALVKSEQITAELLQHQDIDVNQHQKDQVTALNVVTQNGCEAIMLQLLKSPQLEMIEVISGDVKISPLLNAISRKHENIASALVKRFPEWVNHPQNNIYPLLLAAQNKLVNLIPELLANGADLEACLQHEQTPLTLVLNQKKEGVASVLIKECPMLVNQPNQDGLYPLQIAAAHGLIDSIKLLVDKTNHETCYENGKTPLFVALSYKQPQAAALLITPEWVNQPYSINGFTPLHLAAQAGYYDIVLALIANGANAHACIKAEITPLMLAIKNKNENIASVLIKTFPEWVNIESEGLYPLAGAIAMGLVNTVVQLIEHNAELGIEFTALTFALKCKKGIEEKNKDFFPSLIQKYPKLVNQEYKGQVSPLYFAANDGYMDIVDLLLASGADAVKVINSAILNGDEHVVSLLINKNPQWLNQADEKGCSPLNAAAQKGLAPLKDIIGRGANVEACINGFENPLNTALETKNVETATFLIENYPRLINQANGAGTYPLHVAAKHGLDEMVIMLLAHGANIDEPLKGKGKQTSLCVAASKGQFETVEALLEHGADYNNVGVLANGILSKPIKLASSKGHKAIVELLLTKTYSEEDLKNSLNSAMVGWINKKDLQKRQNCYDCSELLYNKLDKSLDKEISIEESNTLDWDTCFEHLFDRRPRFPDLWPSDNDSAIRYALTSMFQLLSNPNECLPYLLDLSQKLRLAWENEYPNNDFPAFDIDTINWWSHQGCWPIPNDKFKQDIKKHSLLERLILSEFLQEGMGKSQSKWTGFVNKKISIELLGQNEFFTENRRTINGLFHGNVHNIQRWILLEAMRKGVVPLSHLNVTVEPREVFSALMRKDIVSKEPHPPLWQKMLDSSISSQDGFTLPHTLHSTILTHEKLAGLLQDYMRYSFCSQFGKMHALFDKMCNKEHSINELLRELSKLDLLLFSVSAEEAIQIEKKKAEVTKVELKSDKAEKSWCILPKNYKPLTFFNGGKEEVVDMELGNNGFNLG